MHNFFVTILIKFTIFCSNYQGQCYLILVVVARISAPHKLSDVEADGGGAGGRGGGDHPKVMVGGCRGGGGRGVRWRARIFHVAKVLRHAQQVVPRVMVFREEAQEVVLLLVPSTLAGRRGHQVVKVGGRRTHPLTSVKAKPIHVWQLKIYSLSPKSLFINLVTCSCEVSKGSMLNSSM